MSFFNKTEIKSTSGCIQCRLYKSCNSPKMPVTGEGRLGYLFMAEAPGYQEDQNNQQLIGKSGQELRKYLKLCGIDLDKDCWKINAVNCRPTKVVDGKIMNRTPTQKEIDYCRHRWKKTIKELKPKKLFLLGSIALDSFIDGRIELGKMERWVGWKIPDQDYKCWVYPLYHPSYLIRNRNDEALHNLFQIHLDEALDHNKPFPVFNPKINIITDTNEAIQLLERIYRESTKDSWLTFDYETSGLKPYRKGHFIRCIGLTDRIGEAWAFELVDDWRLLDLWRLILESPSKKIAQNIFMEDTWSKEILGVTPNRWAFDTMIASHIIDSRSHITGLKFQAYVRYGIPDYSKELESFLKNKKKGEDPKSNNSFNKIDEAPIKKLLEYCAMDCIVTHQLALYDQMSELTEFELDNAYDLFHDGVLAFNRTSQRGVRIDEDYFKKMSKELGDKLDELENKIHNSKENQKWFKIKNKNLEISKTEQTKKLVLKILKLKITKETASSTKEKPVYSVDKSVLQELAKKHQVFADIIKWREIQKLKSTYLDGVLRESIDGVLHPSINLHIPKTYRSSVNSPNMQNIPKRDKEAQKLIRTGFIPRKGHKLIRIDYAGVEVRSGCVYHGDKQMIAYQVEGKGDMHKEYAAKLFCVPIEQVDEPIKYEGKNGFIFPQFYGDYWGNNVKQLWPRSKELSLDNGLTLRENLAENGIKNKQQFEKHVQNIEWEFWNTTFPEFNEWKKKAWNDYLKTMEIWMKTGFRCTGLQSRKNVVNYPFQGTAFHWLLWSFIQIEDMLTIENWDSQLVMQIHDELVLDAHPDEQDELMPIVKQVMTKDIIEYWPWINIPLEVDAKESKIDGNWYEMEGLKI